LTIEEAIEQLEAGIKRLKVQYDMFFAGASQRPPYELRRQVEQLIRTFSNASIRKYHHRFQLNTLIGRYNALSELWGKQLRSNEEGGRAAAAAAAAAAVTGTPAAHAKPDKDGEQVFFSVQVSNPEAEPEAMRALYERYLEARKSNASGRPAIKLESFVQQIARQASNLKETSGCPSIEFRILRKGSTVSLKARAATKESR